MKCFLLQMSLLWKCRGSLLSGTLRISTQWWSSSRSAGFPVHIVHLRLNQSRFPLYWRTVSPTEAESPLILTLSLNGGFWQWKWTLLWIWTEYLCWLESIDQHLIESHFPFHSVLSHSDSVGSKCSMPPIWTYLTKWEIENTYRFAEIFIFLLRIHSDLVYYTL